MENKTVLVTGSGAGIGRAIAERCADKGANAVITDVDVGDGTETVERIEQAGGTASFYELDVTNEAAFVDVVSAVDDEYGRLDVLYNNAGITYKADFEETTNEQLEQQLAVNVYGVWYGCKAAIPLMKAQESGAVVNTASIGGVIGMQTLSGYNLTKGAVVNFTRGLAVDVGQYNIRVNAICPGSVDHEMKELESNLDEVKTTKTALGRMGSTGEMASVAAFLGSEDASFVTGQAIVVDGGRTATE